MILRDLAYARNKYFAAHYSRPVLADKPRSEIPVVARTRCQSPAALRHRAAGHDQRGCATGCAGRARCDARSL